jgi:type II secretory pathway pseudopilin PulG
LQQPGTRGSSLAECVVVLFIMGLMAGTTIPMILRALHRLTLRSAAAQVQAALVDVRSQAVRLHVGRAARFQQMEDDWGYAVYEDGDDDGVLSTDIASGVDRLVQPLRPLDLPLTSSWVGLPPAGIPDPDTGDWVFGMATPVNFNRSSMCSFSKDGTGTPGSIYITNASGGAAVVRSSGAGGDIHTLYWWPGEPAWKP